MNCLSLLFFRLLLMLSKIIRPRSKSMMIQSRQLHRPILALLCLSLIIGCQKNRSESSTEQGIRTSRTAAIRYATDDVIQLDGERLSESDVLGRPHAIERVGDYLLVADFSGNPFAHILRAEDGTHVSSIEGRGEGPGEFQSIWSFDVGSNDAGVAWIYDMTSLRLTRINVSDYVEGAHALGDSLISFDIGFTLTAPHWLGDSLVVSPGFLNEEGRLAYLVPDQGTLHHVAGPSLPEHDGVPEAVRQHAYQAYMTTSPDRSSLALATRYADRIEIYDAEGDLEHIVEGPDGKMPVFEVATYRGEPTMQTTNQTWSGYLDIAADSSRIYALYAGKSRNETLSGAASRVHVLSWDGELVGVYELDAPVLGIALGDRSRTLYATQIAPHPAIVQYDLTRFNDTP